MNLSIFDLRFGIYERLAVHFRLGPPNRQARVNPKSQIQNGFRMRRHGSQIKHAA